MQIQPAATDHGADRARPPHLRSSAKRTRRLGPRSAVATAAVAAAAVTILLGGAAGGDAGPADSHTPADQTGVAAWAATNGMWGGAPTSLRATSDGGDHTVADVSAAAAWAVAHDLRGSSPTSLGRP